MLDKRYEGLRALETGKQPEDWQADGLLDFLSDLHIRVPKPVSLGAVSITPEWWR